MNNTTNNNIEQELNDIRIKLYEQTKDMTSAEQVEFFNNRGREVLARQGIKAKFAFPPPVRLKA